MISRRQIIDSHQLTDPQEHRPHRNEQQARKKAQVPRTTKTKTKNKPLAHRPSVYDLDVQAEDDYEDHYEDGGRLEGRYRHKERLAAKRAELDDDCEELVSGSENNDQDDEEEEDDDGDEMIDNKRPMMMLAAHQRDKNFKYYKGGRLLRGDRGEQQADERSDGRARREREQEQGRGDSFQHESLLDDAINIRGQLSNESSSKSQALLDKQDKLHNGLARRRQQAMSSDQDQDRDPYQEQERDQDRSRKPRRLAPPRGRLLGPMLRNKQHQHHQQDSALQVQQQARAQAQENSSSTASRGGDGGCESSIDVGNFDPYSVYGDEDEEEDVWYSEERLFEVSVVQCEFKSAPIDVRHINDRCQVPERGGSIRRSSFLRCQVSACSRHYEPLTRVARLLWLSTTRETSLAPPPPLVVIRR